MTVLENDSRFKFGPPLVQTAEDAVNAYLRGEINEKELRDAFGRFGVSDPSVLFGTVPPRPERIDAAFQRDIPDDLLYAGRSPAWELKARQKLVDEKQKLRDEATKLAEKDKTVEETRKREADSEQTNKLIEKHTFNPLSLEKASQSKGTATPVASTRRETAKK